MDEEPPGSKVSRLASQRKVYNDEDIEQLLRDLGNESDDGLELFESDDEPDEESDGENDDDDSNLPNLSNARAGVIPENIELTSEQSLENENVEQDSADSIDARIAVLPGLDANSLNNLNVASLEFISEPDTVANDLIHKNFQVVQIVPAESVSHQVLPEEATTSTQLNSTEDIIVAPDSQVIEQPPSVIPAPLDHLPAAGSGASPPPSRTWKRNRPSVPNIPFNLLGSTFFPKNRLLWGILNCFSRQPYLNF